MKTEFDDPYRYDLQSITVKEEEENLEKIRILEEKIQNLEEINAQKESIIRVLEEELKDIERNFKEMERNIMGILKHRSTAYSGGKVEESQLNEALKEMLCDMELQKSELKRLHTDC
jgi:DNA gyrase/topoisomerase IV subunit A